MRKLVTGFFVLVASTISFSQLSYAHSFRSCASSASDADNDGYGFENGGTCIVDTFSTGAPSFTNLETGNPVALTRAYWNGLDFKKDIVCSSFFFNGMSYERHNATIHQLVHRPLTTTEPYVGEVEINYVLYNNGTPNSTSYVIPWGVDNGIYSGANDLGRTPWLELISLGNGQGAVRIWISEQIYKSCSATNPNDFFSPTGTPPDTGNSFDGTCVDTGAVDDGWGWNGSSSCMITPVDSPTVGECIDSDGDGWGWNGVSSCSVESTEVIQCVDTDGDGWGWDGTDSCRI